MCMDEIGRWTSLEACPSGYGASYPDFPSCCVSAVLIECVTQVINITQCASRMAGICCKYSLLVHNPHFEAQYTLLLALDEANLTSGCMSVLSKHDSSAHLLYRQEDSSRQEMLPTYTPAGLLQWRDSAILSLRQEPHLASCVICRCYLAHSPGNHCSGK